MSVHLPQGRRARTGGSSAWKGCLIKEIVDKASIPPINAEQKHSLLIMTADHDSHHIGDHDGQQDKSTTLIIMLDDVGHHDGDHDVGDG